MGNNIYNNNNITYAAASADDIERFETYINAAAVVYPASCAYLQDTRRSSSSSSGAVSAQNGIYDDLKGSSQCRIRACTIHVHAYVYCILYVNTDLVFSAEGMRVPRCMYVLVYVYRYTGAAERRRNCVHNCAQYPHGINLTF